MYGEEADLCRRARARGARPRMTPEATHRPLRRRRLAAALGQGDPGAEGADHAGAAPPAGLAAAARGSACSGSGRSPARSAARLLARLTGAAARPEAAAHWGAVWRGARRLARRLPRPAPPRPGAVSGMRDRTLPRDQHRRPAPEPARHLAAFLASLYAQDFDMGRAEVIVVDNGSRVLPEAVVAPYPGGAAGLRADARARGRRATAAPRWRGRRSSSSPTPTARRRPTGCRRSSPASPPTPASPSSAARSGSSPPTRPAPARPRPTRRSMPSASASTSSGRASR